MDGHYASLAFICTKTDIISSSETINALELWDECSDLEKQIDQLTEENEPFQTELDTLNGQMKQLSKMKKQHQTRLLFIFFIERLNERKKKTFFFFLFF